MQQGRTSYRLEQESRVSPILHPQQIHLSFRAACVDPPLLHAHIGRRKRLPARSSARRGSPTPSTGCRCGAACSCSKGGSTFGPKRKGGSAVLRNSTYTVLLGVKNIPPLLHANPPKYTDFKCTHRIRTVYCPLPLAGMVWEVQGSPRRGSSGRWRSSDSRSARATREDLLSVYARKAYLLCCYTVDPPFFSGRI